MRPNKPEFVITGKFKDENMAAFIAKVHTLEQAQREAAIMANKLAAMKSISIRHPDGTKDVYNGQGVYFFTIPAGILL